MTDDYLAISNTGKNITITMTPGMKYVLCDNLDRLRMVYSAGSAVFFPALPPDGYKLCKRKNVWNVSMASARCPDWPIHERAVYRMSQIEFQGGAERVTLPKPAADDFDSKTIAEFQRSDFQLGTPPPPIHKELRQFNVPDMVVAAIAGGAIGVLITLLLAAAGVLK